MAKIEYSSINTCFDIKFFLERLVDELKKDDIKYIFNSLAKIIYNITKDEVKKSNIFIYNDFEIQQKSVKKIRQSNFGYKLKNGSIEINLNKKYYEDTKLLLSELSALFNKPVYKNINYETFCNFFKNNIIKEIVDNKTIFSLDEEEKNIKYIYGENTQNSLVEKDGDIIVSLDVTIEDQWINDKNSVFLKNLYITQKLSPKWIEFLTKGEFNADKIEKKINEFNTLYEKESFLKGYAFRLKLNDYGYIDTVVNQEAQQNLINRVGEASQKLEINYDSLKKYGIIYEKLNSFMYFKLKVLLTLKLLMLYNGKNTKEMYKEYYDYYIKDKSVMVKNMKILIAMIEGFLYFSNKQELDSELKMYIESFNEIFGGTIPPEQKQNEYFYKKIKELIFLLLNEKNNSSIIKLDELRGAYKTVLKENTVKLSVNSDIVSWSDEIDFSKSVVKLREDPSSEIEFKIINTIIDENSISKIKKNFKKLTFKKEDYETKNYFIGYFSKHNEDEDKKRKVTRGTIDSLFKLKYNDLQDNNKDENFLKIYSFLYYYTVGLYFYYLKKDIVLFSVYEKFGFLEENKNFNPFYVYYKELINGFEALSNKKMIESGLNEKNLYEKNSYAIRTSIKKLSLLKRNYKINNINNNLNNYKIGYIFIFEKDTVKWNVVENDITRTKRNVKDYGAFATIIDYNYEPIKFIEFGIEDAGESIKEKMGECDYLFVKKIGYIENYYIILENISEVYNNIYEDEKAVAVYKNGKINNFAVNLDKKTYIFNKKAFGNNILLKTQPLVFNGGEYSKKMNSDILEKVFLRTQTTYFQNMLKTTIFKNFDVNFVNNSKLFSILISTKDGFSSDVEFPLSVYLAKTKMFIEDKCEE